MLIYIKIYLLVNIKIIYDSFIYKSLPFLSVVFLDEVSTNIDEAGVEGIYRMICELAKDKQVFVIDHNQNLLSMLEGCDTINLEMKNEITKKI